MTYYHIVADYISYGKPCTCLVYGGTTNREDMEKVLERIINSPTPDDLYSLGKGKNVRIEETNERPWWMDGTD